MERNSETTIFFVDDEPQICKAVKQTLDQLENCRIFCFEDAASCLMELRVEDCDLLITDVNMPGMNGIMLLEHVRKVRPQMPVLLVTGYGDIPMAVKAMKAGAMDFIEKPLNESTFMPAVEAALAKTRSADRLSLDMLTRSEIRILKLIGEGKSNKEIAQHLRRSVRTVENHRYRLMHKLGVNNAVELLKKAIRMGLATSD